MKCVECGSPVERLYEEPVKGNIVLTVCENCGKCVDKYIEYEYTLIFLNLILCKSQVYRHILFNSDFCVSISEIIKFFLISCFLDVILARCNQIECWGITSLYSVLKGVGYIGLLSCVGTIVEGKFEVFRIVRAVLVASFGKLGSFMIVIWDYSFFHNGTMRFFIYMNHVIAVKEVLEISLVKAVCFVFVAAIIVNINELGNI